MNKQQLSEIISRIYREIDKSFDRLVRHHYREDDIHAFRVGVKRLRALVHVIAIGAPEWKGKVPRKLRGFYKAIGVVRNLQLLQRSVRSSGGNGFIMHADTYEGLLDAEIATNRANAAKMVSGRKMFGNGEKKLIAGLPERIDTDNIGKWAREEVGTIGRTMGAGLVPPETLHEARKTLKDILYAVDWLGMKILTGLSFRKKEDLKALTDLLGEYRDSCIRIGLLGADYVGLVKDRREAKFLHALKVKWMEEREGLERKIAGEFGYGKPAAKGTRLSLIK